MAGLPAHVMNMIAHTPSTNLDGHLLVDALLIEQQQTTAVEQFARWHEHADAPRMEKHYRDLMSVEPPREGQQYAFEVDLDACSGCKSCVVACHNLNGLEENELWRGVGLLHGGSRELPVIQHVTAACHHCLQPSCLDGCPVEAYEKDPVTGIVRHLDDQCIGCQYCIFKCPYDVPKYSRSKGIVRKCDMCSDRLADGEAPACVQACPNEAIRITLVDKQAVADESEANLFLPGAPEPGYTLPTTIYKTQKPLPRNLLPADYYSAQPQHSHLPLVVMLVLTQMSVGAFFVDQALGWFASWPGDGAMFGVRAVHLVAALALGILGLGAAVFHLGRPFYAFRAWIGLRRSWLSREIVAFGFFALFAAAYAGLACLELLGSDVSPWLQKSSGLLAALTGLAGVFCSVMIYADTRRPFWKGSTTAMKFFLTSLVLGLPVALLISLLATVLADDLTVRLVMSGFGHALCRVLVVAVAVKLLLECVVFTHLRDRQHSPLKRTALLMTGELGLTTIQRYFFGIVGGILLPGLLAIEMWLTAGAGFHPLFIGIVVGLSIAVLLLGELLERYLFFTAVVAPKMPGSPTT